MKTFSLFIFFLLGYTQVLLAQKDSVVIPDPDEYDWSTHIYLGPFINMSIGNYAQLKNALNRQGIDFSRIQTNSIADLSFVI